MIGCFLPVGLADEVGGPVKLARTVLNEMETAVAQGLGDRDASIVLTLQEVLSSVG